MSGETQAAKQLVAEVMSQSQYDRDSMGQALIQAVIEHYLGYRKLADVKQELQYTVDNLDEDEFVITRGC